MEARLRLRRVVLVVVAMVSALGFAGVAKAANYRTQNFLIHAPDQQLAQAVGEAAERHREELAIYWLGAPLPPWPVPCPVRVIAGPNLAAQGVTTYNRAPVRDFQMEVVGTPERILDSVLPHEVTHTVLATHFGRPLPRWADEGISTTVEHESERRKHDAKLREFLATRRGIAMNTLFLLTEYPDDVLPMYAQGYSVCRFLIDQSSPQEFIRFLEDYMRNPSWTANIRKHYGYESLAELQDYWLAWVAAGSGPVEKFAKRGSNIDATGGHVAIHSPSNNVAAANATADGTAAAGSVRLAQQTAPPAKPAPASPPAAATTALASSHADGWYQRRKLNGDPPTAPRPSSPRSPSSSGLAQNRLVPPSVRRSGIYSAAQPQPEQSFSRSGVALRPLDHAPEPSAPYPGEAYYPGGADLRPPGRSIIR
ncbi:MAG: hypothetical protein ACF788_04850 [Novipirellula sp. JB048]